MKTPLTKDQKQEYWANREAGLRGQTSSPKPRVFKTSDVEMRLTKRGLMAFPRRARRTKVVDRLFTKKGCIAEFDTRKSTYVAFRIGSKAHNLFKHHQRKQVAK